MIISKEKVESIIKTLPISYYIKRGVKIELKDCATSYYDMMNDSIVISFNNLTEAVKNLSNEEDIEFAVRCLTYHEVSHAFLTPKRLNTSNIMNVFEDERIETICKKFYMNVDFKKFVKLLNDYHGQLPKDAFEGFYQLVRYRVGPQEFLDRVKKLIFKYANIQNYEVLEYTVDVDNLWKDYKEYFEKQQEEKEEKNKKQEEENTNLPTNEQEKKEEKNEKREENNNGKQEEEETNNEVQANVEMEEKNEEEEREELPDPDIMKKTVESKLSNLYDEKLESQLQSILFTKKILSKSNGSAINSYSGVFNPRSVIRDDYKYFVQQNRLGNVKQFSKIHLNLFIDKSGSFRNCEKKINTMLHALKRLEKLSNDFSFTVIHCGIGEKIMPKDNIAVTCEGGNALSPEIYNIVRKVRNPQANNFNIVLFDGDAYFNTWYYNMHHENKCKKTEFKAFDSSNTLIISDFDNKPYLKEMTKAKIIFTKDYVQEFYSNILTNLERLLK